MRRKAPLPAALLVILAATLISCSQPPQTPPAGPPELYLNQLVRQFDFNQKQARQAHHKNWYTVKAGPVTKVSNRTAYVYTRPFVTILQFTRQEDAWAIAPDETIRAVCRLDGLLEYEKIVFKHCRWPEQPQPAQSGNATE